MPEVSTRTVGLKVSALDNPVLIGRFLKPFGLAGELRVRSETMNLDRWKYLKQVYIQNGIDSSFYRYEIEKYSLSDNRIRLVLKGVNSSETASLLTNREIFIPEADRAPVAENEFYIDNLIGFSAETEDGDFIGILIEVLQQGHHDLWVFDGPFGEVLIPAIHEFILNVDEEKHGITVREVKGLWDKT